MDKREQITLRFASLLHDIGKFWQGAEGKGKHAELSARFIRQYLPQLEKASFVASHHDYEKYKGEGYELLKILVIADWLSSGERREIEEDAERGKRKETPMLSIFSEINLEGREKAKDMYLAPTIYDPLQPIYPSLKIEDVSSSYKALWESFIKDIEKIKIKDIDGLFETLFYIVKKHCLFIPAAVYKSIPDISLFDHAKATCAIADCLYKINDIKYLDTLIDALRKREGSLNEAEEKALREEKFLLIGGDISGIQKFIYTIISKKAVKGLKGRSFHLEILSKIVARYILEKLELSIANIIYCAGGHFYILAPIDAKEKLDEIRKDIANKLFEIYKGGLYLALDGVPISAMDFLIEEGKTKFAEKWAFLMEKLYTRKKKKFEEIIKEEIFKPIDAKDVCRICGSPIENDEDVVTGEDELIKCGLCSSFEELAYEMKKKYMIIKKIDGLEDGWKRPFSYFGYTIEFSNGIPYDESMVMVYKINDTNFDEINNPMGFIFYLATKTEELNELAKRSKGLKRWGVLKGDVDDLGRIFSEGLENATISRTSTLSSMISFFFSGRMNKICEKYKDEIYGIYSGGDDFFIIGSWDILPNLAKDIYNDFRKFTCYNPSITLSMAISIAPSIKYPVYKLADVVNDELEEKAKKNNKNAIAFLGKAIKWGDFEKVEKIKEELRKAVENGLSKGFLQKMYAIHYLYKKMKEKAGEIYAKYDDRFGRWKWMLAYVLAREEKIKDKDKWKEIIKENISHLDVAVRWVEFLERKEVIKGE